jgi:hypothetical protein
MSVNRAINFYLNKSLSNEQMISMFGLIEYEIEVYAANFPNLNIKRLLVTLFHLYNYTSLNVGALMFSLSKGSYSNYIQTTLLILSLKSFIYPQKRYETKYENLDGNIMYVAVDTTDVPILNHSNIENLWSVKNQYSVKYELSCTLQQPHYICSHSNYYTHNYSDISIFQNESKNYLNNNEKALGDMGYIGEEKMFFPYRSNMKIQNRKQWNSYISSKRSSIENVNCEIKKYKILNGYRGELDQLNNIFKVVVNIIQVRKILKNFNEIDKMYNKQVIK